jgi:hypothetical protein
VHQNEEGHVCPAASPVQVQAVHVLYASTVAQAK